MGDINTVFFGDLVQLLLVSRDDKPIGEPKTFCFSGKYRLIEPARQTEAIFIKVLNNERVCQFKTSVIKYANSRAVLKTIRKLVNTANSKDFEFTLGESLFFLVHDTYNGDSKNSATCALKETRLLQEITRSVPGTSYIKSLFSTVSGFGSNIHKAQNATIKSVIMHLDNITHGQLYVAMFRVRKDDSFFFFESNANIPEF
ncbi:uncharacterized protein B0P05DRAFT_581801 [Gilbertella persicaria]|uniref:uncharacterized protein n=1 Tax=Gilbertella persicaria TaxID=101096 RepID=UPI00221E9231|nr:uncharacterized protein B0P05DRAFT_581801 [Gilbertella persicaria]KAI8053655.1 hypothetical protein B0P05DRAFT_581801 [Gilbertella persicaria]